jgi:hypothetical protein
MKKNIILIPPSNSYGDIFSVISLLYFLLKFYEKVHLYCFDEVNLNKYFDAYFENDGLYKQRIFIINNPTQIINEGEFGDYDFCNTLTYDWTGAQFNFYHLENVDKEYYFNCDNPLYNKFNIEEKYLYKPNRNLPNVEPAINHIIYYELVGLNNMVRMEFFNYIRNTINENIVKNNLLSKNKIYGQYNIVNDPIGTGWTQFIKNNLPTINISNIARCTGELLSLIENAEEIHLIEGNNTNFLYHSQYKGIFKYEKKIYFHIWQRNRNWPDTNISLDFAWKMMSEPKLNNWDFIF